MSLFYEKSVSHAGTFLTRAVYNPKVIAIGSFEKNIFLSRILSMRLKNFNFKNYVYNLNII